MTRWLKTQGRIGVSIAVLIGPGVGGSLGDSGPEGLRPIRLTLVDGAAHYTATFQSHNQKVVANRNGIFMTHLRSRNESDTAQEWRLSRSVDSGRSFSMLHESVDATNPPVLETDRGGKVYVAHPNFGTGNVSLYRLSPEDGFRFGEPIRLAGAAAGKYAMAIDEARGQLYFLSHNNRFFVVGLEGGVRRSYDLLRPGEHAALQYPHLAMDPKGSLHGAWTTVQHDEYTYRSIHHLVSSDGGRTWGILGSDKALSLPVVADETGGSLCITPEEEFQVHTWLSGFLAGEEKVHFFYRAQSKPPLQHYLRYDAASGKEDLHHRPRFGGSEIEVISLDGFFSAEQVGRKRVFCVARDAIGHLVCLVSRDQGATWEDFAKSEEKFNPYSIGGCRTLGSDGALLGSFTDQRGVGIDDRSSRVYFFRIDTREMEPRGTGESGGRD